MKDRIMYIECKGSNDDIIGVGRIGRVSFSKTGKTIYYKGKKLQSLRDGYKANYYDVETGETYWVSGPKKNGQDTLYPGYIEVDEDVRVEYWRDIRGLVSQTEKTRYRSAGKYKK